MSRHQRRVAQPLQFIHLGAPGSATPAGAVAAAGHIALVPGAAAPLLPLLLPAGLRGAAREQVAWRQLHDQLGLSPREAEMRPFGGAGKAGASWVRAVVADSAVMAGWRAALAPGCRALLPDYLALPAAADLWVLEVGVGPSEGLGEKAGQGENAGAKTVRMRLGLLDGFSAEEDLAQLMLAQRLAAGGPLPKAVLLLAGDAPWLAPLLAAADIPLLQKAAALKSMGLAAPVVLGHGELAADLRRDPRAARQRLGQQLLPWRWPLLAALLVLGLWATTQIVEIRQLRRDTAVTRTEVERIVRDHFIANGPLLDVRLQVARALAARQSEGSAGSHRVSPLLLLGQVADVLAAAAAVPDLLSYSLEEGLRLQLRLADFAAVDALLETLEAAGIATELGAAEAGSGRDGGDGKDGGGGGDVRVDLRLRHSFSEAVQ